MTNARRGGGLDLGFDSHERRTGLSGSSKPMYWKVMLCFVLGCDLLTMVQTKVNLEGVRGSKVWCWWLETTSEKM